MQKLHRVGCGLYVFGGRGRTRTFFLFFAFFLLAYIERDPESDRFGHPPRIMILWRSIESNTQIAQLRWRNALAWSPLEQRRHGRRRHNYGGATSFSQRWANIFLPTICQRCRPCWKKSEVKILVLWFSEGAFVFPVSNTKLVIKMVLNLNVPFGEKTWVMQFPLHLIFFISKQHHWWYLPRSIENKYWAWQY